MNGQSKVISIRLSVDDYERIKKLSDKANKSVSSFMTEASIADKGLTRSQKQVMYFHLSKMKDLARNECDEIGSAIIKECDAIWQKLR